MPSREKRYSLSAPFAAAVAALVLGLFAAPRLSFASGTTTKRAARTTVRSRTSAKSTTAIRHKHVVVGVPTLADSAKDDDGQFDDPVVRAAALAGLGHYNGSVVALDPNTGRILSVVNQKLAFSSGFIPCSTIKPVIAVAALEENVITRDSMIKVAPRRYMNLVEALAHSNNAFFEELGRRMGFDTVSHYARLLGLGELAGYNLSDEQPGALPSEPPVNGGVARMSSFGEGIQITPLQLASVVATLANGGTMYYLQYPHSQQELANFQPIVKRKLDIASLVPDIRDGMLAAVMYGTAHRSYDADGEQLLGKTGTCSDSASRVGWFVSYANQVHPKLVLAVLMRGHGAIDSGPMASGIAGRIYHRLDEENYFADKPGTAAPSAALSPAHPQQISASVVSGQAAGQP